MTASGQPCRNWTTAGFDTCRFHRAGYEPPFWTRQRVWRLTGMIEDGKTDREIARALGTTVNGVQIARKRFGIKSRTQVLNSSRTVALRMGVGCAKTVVRWIEKGWLRGRQGPARGANRQWLVTEAALLDFLEDPDHWHRWEPGRIQDAALREWTQELRGHVRFLSLSDVARRCFVQSPTVHQWIAKGWLPAVRTGDGDGNHLVPESALADFHLPHIGGRPTEHSDRETKPLQMGNAVYQITTTRVGEGWSWEAHGPDGTLICGSRRPSRQWRTAWSAARVACLKRGVA